MILTEKVKFHVLLDGHVTTPKGFSAGGLHCGLRKSKLDLGWIHSEVPATAAGVYTLNTFQAAPVKVTKENIHKEGKVQTIIVNSGNANACTGKQGEDDALEMQQLTAEKMNVALEHVAVASTGVIGEVLPMEKVRKGIENMGELPFQSPEYFEEAILTTDTMTKHIAVQIEIDGKTITIGGAAKGSGMIHPNMATMLGFITTDAEINQASLQRALHSVTDKTFNMITVDGDTSTNDMVLVLANGMQKNQPLDESHLNWGVFVEALQYVSEELAKRIAQDGEGATKLIEVNVQGAPTELAAKQVAKAIISSNLVKTAMYGADPNWGRIVCAIGYSEQPIDPSKVSISLGDIEIVKNGMGLTFDEEKGKQYLENDTVTIHVHLHDGTKKATAWGCDLTYDYVKINASYRT